MSKVFNILQNNIIKWLLVILCMLGIFAMSHLDSVKSWYMTGKILTTVTQTQDEVADMDYKDEVGYYSADEQDFGMHLLRKMAHVAEFFVLFLLWVNALWDKRQVIGMPIVKRLFAQNINSTMTYAALFTMLYAAFDEAHQLFIVGRTGTVGDVLIDGIGVVLGLLLIRVVRISGIANNILLDKN